MLRLQIQSCKDRENLIVALANAGYSVKVKEERLFGMLGSNFFVELIDFDGKEINKKSTIEELMNKK